MSIREALVRRLQPPMLGDAPRRAESSKRVVLAILIVAVILGGSLRFYRLGADEMSRGEAASWTAAAAPSLSESFALSQQLNPGKAGIYDVALHLWIDAVGDSVGAMRAFSALLGTLMILLLFLAAREILVALDEGDRDGILCPEWAPAFAVILFACNLRMVTTDRTARMYTLMLIAAITQICFFIRSCRRPGAANVIAAALFAALAIASNIIVLGVFAAEALWLALLWHPPQARIARVGRSAMRPAAALALAAALFLPLGIADGRAALGALHAGVWETIEPQPPWWPLRALMVMTGNAAFWPLLLMALYAIWRQRSPHRLGISFMLCWLLIPFGLIEIASYAITPMMVERYVLPSLIAFLVLAAIGIASVRNRVLRYAIATLVVGQSLAHLHHHWRTPEDVQWREAARFAVVATPADQRVAVVPLEPLMVLRYYLDEPDRLRLVGARAQLDPATRIWRIRCGPEPTLIADSALPPASLQQISACYPRLLKRFRLVEVRAKSPKDCGGVRLKQPAALSVSRAARPA